ncbi:hypothetical protein [Metallosphaera hakonensis]|nr:hypothetical protein [Metallosphaera hakonensis]
MERLHTESDVFVVLYNLLSKTAMWTKGLNSHRGNWLLSHSE